MNRLVTTYLQTCNNLFADLLQAVRFYACNCTSVTEMKYTCTSNFIFTSGNALPGDVVVFLSHSGNTKECLEVARHLKKRDVPVLAIVGQNGNLNQTNFIYTG